ncbi:hypothetical protein [Sphingomonas sp. PAMC 26605]|uniref:hypothetical protein n=1 Tax=Sphingomonas sp. PAMC 26605 TaxID=1112214 RepID=UPI00026CCA4D|nr:hypothetical protein [Sphingomonas sp. PAMC 26605]
MATAPLTATTFKSSTQSVRFDDGMIVTAEDLTLATGHPLALLQVLVRAYFGCGVVCGFALKPRRDADDHTPCPVPDIQYALSIGTGVALDCAGFPLELCGPVCVDLKPDPCVTPGPLKPGEQRLLHIAIRRVDGPAGATKGGCGCGGSCGCGGGDQGCASDAQCARLRDAVELGVFLDLPEGICQTKPVAAEATGTTRDQGGGPGAGLCACLKTCPDCDRCCDWVYLGQATIDENGIVAESVKLDRRAYVKPVACICDATDSKAPPPPSSEGTDAITAKLNLYRDESVKTSDAIMARSEAQEAVIKTLQDQLATVQTANADLGAQIQRLSQATTPATNQKLRAELDKMTARIEKLETPQAKPA